MQTEQRNVHATRAMLDQTPFIAGKMQIGRVMNLETSSFDLVTRYDLVTPERYHFVTKGRVP
jgi:hypothetical protein